MKITLPLLTLACLFGAVPLAHCAGQSVSTPDPTALAFQGEGDRLYVYPGNNGPLWFSSTPQEDPGNLEPWQDVYCDARWLDLESPDYEFHIADTSTTGAQEYWQRMEQYIGNCTINGNLPIWRITDDFVETWQAQPHILDDTTSHARHYYLQDLLDPTFVISTTQPAAETLRLCNQLRDRLPGWAVGVHVNPSNLAVTPPRGWSFVICDEEAIPEAHRGQSAVSWVRSKFGQLPVILSPIRPDFQRDMVWLGSGSSGIWFRPLPDKGTAANAHGAIHMRATSVYLNRFGNDQVKLSVIPDHNALNLTLNAEAGWASIITAKSHQLKIPLPAQLQGKVITGNWFNPATDENIIEPLTTLSGDVLTVSPPSESLWAYSLSLSTVAPDTQSTTSAIKELF